ncbi:hypothetical protein [Enterococcus sp. AZ072]|uniref:hypothetical protein n=1 Tax=unclassified Enterococcus TaxID=2608891 RepID=UPI003D26C82B
MKPQQSTPRRLIYLIVSVGLVLLLVSGSYLVYAAMIASDRKENDFQIGQVETKLDQVFDGNIKEISKSQSVEMKVSIKNTGTIKQFVRVMVLPEVRADVIGDPGSKQILPLAIGTDLTLEQLNTTDWKDGGDGYYYYVKEAVEPKKPTTALFDSIKLSDNLSDQYNDAEFSLTLKAETINCTENSYRQSWWQGNTPTEGPLKTIDDILKTKLDT